MLRFLIFICVVFSCLELSGQEIIFIGKDKSEVINHVKKLESYREIKLHKSSMIEAKDSLNNNHYYMILERTNECITQLHIYNQPILLINTLHVFKGLEVLETTKFEEGKYYRSFYKYGQETDIY